MANNKPISNTKQRIGFGVAMSAIFVNTEIQSDIVDFTWDGGQQAVLNEFSTAQRLNVDQIFGASEFSVLNTFYTYTNLMFPSTFNQFVFPENYVSGISPVSPGDQLDPDAFTGGFFFEFFFVGTEATPQYLGFCTRENNVGWFKVYFQSEDDLVIEAGELAREGETLTVGGTDDPFLLGDANCNGVVSLLDVSAFVEQVSTGTFVDKSDMNRDGVVNLLDVGPFIALLNGDGLAFVENGELTVRTTTADDSIVVSQVGDFIQVVANGIDFGVFNADRIQIESRQGNDTIDIHPSVTLETTIYAGAGDDTIFGGSGTDNIFGAQGNDLIFGRGGDDYIVGAAGTNEIHGQDGADTIYGGQFGTIFGGNGDDELHGFRFADSIFGGAGDDRIFSGDGDDFVEGGIGDDLIRGELGFNEIYGQAGNDDIRSDGPSVLSGGDGNDEIFGSNYDDEISGGLGDDRILGLSGDDVITGGDGDDELNGFRGDDVIRGGLGNDIIRGGRDNDTLAGQGGDDMLDGQQDVDSAEDFGELGHLNIEIDLF